MPPPPPTLVRPACCAWSLFYLALLPCLEIIFVIMAHSDPFRLCIHSFFLLRIPSFDSCGSVPLCPAALARVLRENTSVEVFDLLGAAPTRGCRGDEFAAALGASTTVRFFSMDRPRRAAAHPQQIGAYHATHVCCCVLQTKKASSSLFFLILTAQQRANRSSAVVSRSAEVIANILASLFRNRALRTLCFSDPGIQSNWLKGASLLSLLPATLAGQAVVIQPHGPSNTCPSAFMTVITIFLSQSSFFFILLRLQVKSLALSRDPSAACATSHSRMFLCQQPDVS